MIKKLRALVCVLVSAVFVGATLAGCALFQEDVRYDYSQVVARMGGIEINKKQLMDGYNNFGYRYVTEQGLSLEEAYDKTAEQLIDREVAIIESKRLYGDLTPDEIKSARKVSYDSIEKAYRGYEKEIRDKKFPSAVSAPEVKEEEKPEPVKYTAYEKFIEYKQNTYLLNLEKYKIETEPEFVYANDDDFINFLKTPRDITSSVEKAITAEAFNKLVRVMQSVEKGVGVVYVNGKMTFENVKYDTEEQRLATIKRELVRMQTEEGKNILLRRLQDAFNWGLGGVDKIDTGKLDENDKPVYMNYNELKEMRKSKPAEFENTIHRANEKYVNDVARRATEDFVEKVRNARYRLKENFEDESSYYSKLLDSFKDLYYVPENIAKQFFTVSHILLKYDDEQTAKIKEIKDQYAIDHNVENRDRALQNVKNSLRVRKVIDGEYVGEEMNADEVLAYVKSYVSPFLQTKSLDAKIRDFHKLIYVFGAADNGMQNNDFEYVIGRDAREDRGINSKEKDEMSRMVPEFNAAARALFNYNETEHRGGVMRAQDYVDQFGVSKNIFKNNEYNLNKNVSTLGTISDLVWTDYGAHIIMYTRNVTDILFHNPIVSITENNVREYMHKTWTSYGNKTYFDASVETVQRPQYAQYEEQLLRDYKSGKTVVLERGAYKNLTKS